MLEKVQSIDPSVLLSVARQAQQDPQFEITEWTVRPLSNKGIINPEGLLLFAGHGRSGPDIKPWSVVMKVLRRQEQEPPLTDMWYWKRELLAFESGLLTHLPGPVVAPRYFGSLELTDGVGLWMEHVVETAPARWTLDHYAFAARQLGQFNGAYLNGSPLPDYPWLSASLLRTWVGSQVEDHEKAWESPNIRAAFPESLHRRWRQVWDERERYYAILDRLPQVFSHFDFQRRNLFIRARPEGQNEVVAADWALCGLGALGADVYSVVGTSLMLQEVDFTAAAALEAVAFEAYLAGLAEAGWVGDPDLVRLGYAAWLGLHWGAAVPAGASWWTSEPVEAYALQQFGKKGKELAADIAAVCEFALGHADEARRLADRLLL
jgi:hypothetical protein